MGDIEIRRIWMERLKKEIAESPEQCPGGSGCQCCRPGCDCGCRNECSLFIGLSAHRLREKDAAELRGLDEGELTIQQIMERNGPCPNCGKLIGIRYIDLKGREYCSPDCRSAANAVSPLNSEWHHGSGYLCCGTVRIAREDFDTNPSGEFKTEMFDWIVKTLNAAEGR